MNLIITLIIIITFSILFSLFARKLKISSVIGLLLVGLIMDIPKIRSTIIEPNSEFLFGLGDFALLALMFLAGFQSSWHKIYSEKKDALFIALFASIIPLLLGMVVFLFFGFSLITSLIIGICMAITAEATKARVLMELNKLRSKVGSAMMGAGIIDDILGFSLFIFITYILKEVYLKEDLLIAGAVLTFFIGGYVHRTFRMKKRNYDLVKNILTWFIIPFFFVSVGLHFEIDTLVFNPVLLVLIITIAIIGKLFGTLLSKPFTSFSWKQLYLIGWAMNSRGAVEMAIALIAFRSGLIPADLYSSLVIMAIITTILFPFIITRMIKTDPDIMD